VKSPAMYCWMRVSNEDTSDTPDRKGNKPAISLLVETEAALKAGQAVDLANETHPFCAMVSGRVARSRAHVANEGAEARGFRVRRAGLRGDVPSIGSAWRWCTELDSELEWGVRSTSA
jgi:hypothetical protein